MTNPTGVDMTTWLADEAIRTATGSQARVDDVLDRSPEEISTLAELERYLRHVEGRQAELTERAAKATTVAEAKGCERRLDDLARAARVAKSRRRAIKRDEDQAADRRKAELADRAELAEARMVLVVDPLLDEFLVLHDRLVEARIAALAAGADPCVKPETGLAQVADGHRPEMRSRLTVFSLADNLAFQVRTNWAKSLPAARARAATLDAEPAQDGGRSGRRRRRP